MITLYGFGPLFDLPDPSPFVMKAEVQLKMAGVTYRWERGGPQGAPKGKIPYIVDRDLRIGDSTFIRDHIERESGVDLDATLTTQQRAQAWAIERMLEDHLYFALLYTRWMIDENFAKGPSQFFTGAPDAVRDAARARVRDNLQGHGLGRHSEDEIIFLASRTLASLAALLGDKPYILGKEACSVDATAFGMLAGILTPFFDTRLRDEAFSHRNLVDYTGRMMTEYYPDFVRKEAA